MPDATEWLVESRDQDGNPEFDHFDTLEEATLFLRERIERGHRDAMLYQHVPFEVQIGVTVKAPRKRRKNSPPAHDPDPAPPLTGPGNGAAGEHSSAAGGMVPCGAHNPAVAGSIPAPATSSWTCEARFDGDPECPARTEWDSVTKGHFCSFHLALIPESHRHEMHRLHASRNRPVRVAHAG
jgi:hypothetical protein